MASLGPPVGLPLTVARDESASDLDTVDGPIAGEIVVRSSASPLAGRAAEDHYPLPSPRAASPAPPRKAPPPRAASPPPPRKAPPPRAASPARTRKSSAAPAAFEPPPPPYVCPPEKYTRRRGGKFPYPEAPPGHRHGVAFLTMVTHEDHPRNGQLVWFVNSEDDPKIVSSLESARKCLSARTAGKNGWKMRLDGCAEVFRFVPKKRAPPRRAPSPGEASSDDTSSSDESDAAPCAPRPRQKRAAGEPAEGGARRGAARARKADGGGAALRAEAAKLLEVKRHMSPGAYKAARRSAANEAFTPEVVALILEMCR